MLPLSRSWVDGTVIHTVDWVRIRQIGGKEDLQSITELWTRSFMGFDNWVKPQLQRLPFIWTWTLVIRYQGFPGGTVSKESACQCRRHKGCRFDPWVGKSPWSKKWQPIPVFFPGKFHGQKAWQPTAYGVEKSSTQLNSHNNNNSIR